MTLSNILERQGSTDIADIWIFTPFVTLAIFVVLENDPISTEFLLREFLFHYLQI